MFEEDFRFVTVLTTLSSLLIQSAPMNWLPFLSRCFRIIGMFGPRLEE